MKYLSCNVQQQNSLGNWPSFLRQCSAVSATVLIVAVVVAVAAVDRVAPLVMLMSFRPLIEL